MSGKLMGSRVALEKRRPLGLERGERDGRFNKRECERWTKVEVGACLGRTHAPKRERQQDKRASVFKSGSRRLPRCLNGLAPLEA